MRSAPDIDALTITTIRTLAINAVGAANSGHPGTPMAMAPAAHCLWHRHLRSDPADPIWPNRDRFVLSVGARLDAPVCAAAPGGGAGGRCRLRARRPAVGHARRHPPVPSTRQPLPGPSRVPAGRPAWKPPPGRSGRGSRRASAWRSRHAGRRLDSTGPIFRCSTTTSTPSAATAV